MSANLSNQSDTSTIDSAVVAASDSPQEAASNAADASAESSTDTTASGKDASIDDLDRQYRESITAKPDPEAQPEPPKAKPEETVETQPETEAVEETVEEPEEQTGPRTFEQLKKQFPRVSEPPLKEIERMDTELHRLQGELNSVGGTVGLEIAKAMLPAMLSADPTDAEVDGVFQSVTETNPALMQRMSWQILTHSLNEESPDPATGQPINIVTGNAIIKQFLDPDYDVEKLQQLVAFDRAGLLDHEELGRELETYSGKSERERQLEERLKTLEAKGKQEEADLESKRQNRVNEHIARTEKYISDKAMERVVAIAEENGWTAKKEELESSDPSVKEFAEFKVALGALLTPWLDNFLRSHNKWGGIESIGKREEAFNLDGNPSKLLKSNGDDLVNAAAAAFKGHVRTMNKVFQRLAKTSRNAQLKDKITTRSGAVDPSDIPPVKKPEPNGKPMTLDEEIAALGREYQRQVRG